MIVNQKSTGASEVLDFRRGLPQYSPVRPNLADLNGGIGQRRAQIDSLVNKRNDNSSRTVYGSLVRVVVYLFTASQTAVSLG